MMDKYSNLNFIKAGMLISALFFWVATTAQTESEKESFTENLFKDKTRFGLTYGNSLLYTENEKNAVGFKYLDQFSSYEIGLTYNIAYLKNFVLSTSLLYRRHRIKKKIAIKKNDFNEDRDLSYSAWYGPYREWKLNTMVDYHFGIYKSLSGFIGIGPELMYARYSYGSSLAGLYFEEEDKLIGYASKDDYNNNFFLGINARLGFSINTKALLIQPFVMYHYQPKTMYTSTVTTQNLLVSENTVSKHSYTGNYLMFGIKIFPSRSLFSSKK